MERQELMKKGGTLKLRSGHSKWGSGRILLVSKNGRSLLLCGDDLPSLPDGSLLVHPSYGKTMLLLRDDTGTYKEVFTGTPFTVQEEEK
jgi:hypothetical protein